MRELDNTFDFLVVGGGIVGTATAYKLSLLYPGSRIALLEKEKELAGHQTGRNSGVIHSGIYYRPGSLKAENCRKGREQLVAFAKEQGLPHSICGKMIVATTEKELPELDRIYNEFEEAITERKRGRLIMPIYAVILIPCPVKFQLCGTVKPI